MALAALAGRRSAQPLTAALNGMAGAMDGMNSANKEQFDRHFKTWERQTDYGLKLVDMHNQEIRSILEDQRLSDMEKQANLVNTYRLFEMDREAAAAHRGDLQSRWQHLEQSERMAQQTRHYKDLILQRNDELEEKKRHDLETEKKARVSGGGVAGEQKQIHDDYIDQWQRDHPGEDVTPEADIEAWQKAKAVTGTARSAPAMFMQQYKVEHPTATSDELAEAMGEYHRVQSLEGGFAGGVLGRQVISLNTVAGHILDVKRYGEALRNGNIPRANAIANQISKEFGGPEVTNFEVGRDIMADEVVRLLTTSGGTAEDRRGMQLRLGTAFSPVQMFGAIGVFGEMITDRYDALRQQYSQGDKKREDRFVNELLTDKSRQLYKKSGASTESPSTPDKPDYSKMTNEELLRSLGLPTGPPQ